MLSPSCLKQHLTRRSGIKLALSALWFRHARAQESKTEAQPVPDLTHSIPARSPQAVTGSQFAESVARMDRPEREHAILSQILAGNLPSFLKKLVSVRLSSPAGTATIFVMPEYLAIGSDADFLRIPMNFHTAKAIAARFRFLLPTRKMVDAIYDQASCSFTPQPLPAGPEMTSTEYYRNHNTMIEKQSHTRGFAPGALAAGHKKDVVLTNRLRWRPTQIAIYGWHRAKGMPIQPLSTVHGAGYADYSHGIRLVAEMALVEGKWRSVRDVLRDALLSSTLSDEGTIRADALLAHA